VPAVPAGKVVCVRAEARSAVPFDQLEVLAGGTVVAKTASGNRLSASVETEVVASASTWVAARCWSRERLPDGQCVYAHTSPVHVEVGGQRPRPDAATVGPLVEVLEHTREWIARAARCPTEQHREHLADIVEAARQELLRRQAPGQGG
jgi:hypothetical protein